MPRQLVFLALTFLFIQPVVASPPALPLDGSDCRLAPASNPSGIAEQVLTGERARDHLRNLVARHPRVFAEARRQMLARGYRPTDVVVVRRTVRTDLIHDSAPLGAPSPRLAQNYSDGEGEITFWSWDDGDDGTWEGTVHVERYSDGFWRTINGQSDISTESYHGVWADLVGEASPSEEFQSRWRNGGAGGDVRFAISTSGHPHAFRRVFVQEFDWDGYWICVAARCGAACPSVCVFAGPLWGWCYGGCCVGTGIIGCALEQLLF